MTDKFLRQILSHLPTPMEKKLAEELLEANRKIRLLEDELEEAKEEINKLNTQLLEDK